MILQVCPAPSSPASIWLGWSANARDWRQSLLLIHAFDVMIIVLYNPDHGTRKQETKTKTVIDERE